MISSVNKSAAFSSKTCAYTCQMIPHFGFKIIQTNAGLCNSDRDDGAKSSSTKDRASSKNNTRDDSMTLKATAELTVSREPEKDDSSCVRPYKEKCANVPTLPHKNAMMCAETQTRDKLQGSIVN